MNNKTKSEALFENFLRMHRLAFERIPETQTRRPDYLVTTGRQKLVFEVKQLSEDDAFSSNGSTRTVGEHIRRKISESRTQIQFAARQDIPPILLIYNAIDPTQMFGTEEHDFRNAMYGDWTLTIDHASGTVREAFHGRNAAFRADKNTSFSALGRLSDIQGRVRVTLFENLHASRQLPFASLPSCFEAVRYELEERTQ